MTQDQKNSKYLDAIPVFDNGHAMITAFKERHNESYRETIRHALGRMHDLETPRAFRLVIIESPYAGDIKRNMAYLHAAIRDCVNRGESPYASHLMLTTALNDSRAHERDLGIAAGLEWATVADAVVVYRDCGISDGMRHAIAEHKRRGRVIEYRNILGEKSHES